MGERDRVSRSHAQLAAAPEVVQRPADDPEPHHVELSEKRGDVLRQRTVNERFEKDRLSSVLALVHRDELGEHGVRTLSTWPPAFDATDQSVGARSQRGLDQDLLRRRVEVHGAGRDVRALRDLADAEARITAASDLA